MIREKRVINDITAREEGGEGGEKKVRSPNGRRAERAAMKVRSQHVRRGR